MTTATHRPTNVATEPLRKLRLDAASATLAAYVLNSGWYGTNCETQPLLDTAWIFAHAGSDSWIGNVFIRKVDRSGEDAIRMTFKVHFAPGGAAVVRAYANDDDGRWCEQALVRNVKAQPPLFVYNESFEDGKYTVRQHSDGRLEALRHGEPWRDLVGDKLMGAMLSEVELLRNEVSRLRRAVVLAETPQSDAAATARSALDAACREAHPQWDSSSHFGAIAQEIRRAEMAHTLAAMPAPSEPGMGSVWMTSHAGGEDRATHYGRLPRIHALAKLLVELGRDAFVKDAQGRIETLVGERQTALESDEAAKAVETPRG